MLKFSPQDKKKLKIIQKLACAHNIKLFLVGGILRDLYLKRQKVNLDFDFCLKHGALKFGKNLAQKLKAGFVILDQEHHACRVVKKNSGQVYTLDFTDFRAASLKEDLGHRDFTVNTLALRLEDALGNKDLTPLIIDLYSGRQDLKIK